MKQTELLKSIIGKQNVKLVPIDGLTANEFACFITYKAFVKNPDILDNPDFTRKQKHDFKKYIEKGMTYVKQS